MENNLNNLVLKLLSQSYLNLSVLSREKRDWAKKHKILPRNSDILASYNKLIKENRIKPSKVFENLLRIKKVRSWSGIVTVAVLTKPYSCPGKCIYCPSQKDMPKSYLNDEPAVMRAVEANFDPYLQVTRRIRQLTQTGHATDKIELIILGGTFSSLPKTYQIDFITKCFASANRGSSVIQNNSSVILIPTLGREKNPIDPSPSPSTLFRIGIRMTRLQKEQKINETTKHRIIGITIETRPDMVNVKEIKFLRVLGVTRVEIGVQTIYDNVLKKIKRGHGVKTTLKATRLLKDAGFKICYHLMPNLPLSTLKRDYDMFKSVFNNPSFKPDMLKIYPCVVVYQAKLYQWFKQKKYKSFTDRQLIDLLVKIKKIMPPWIRINRLGRDIPVSNIASGNKLSNIRQVVKQKMSIDNLKCQCIRCREVKNLEHRTENLVLKINNYKASGGKEYFMQYIDNENRLYALLRLRIPSQFYSKQKHFLPVLQNSAIIRELHTYGEALAIGEKDNKVSQHQGLGKNLILKAEQITKSLGIKKIVVIAGVGSREYYKRLGYKLKNTYMIKYI